MFSRAPRQKKTNQFRDLGKDSLLVQFLNFLKIDKSERIIPSSQRGFLPSDKVVVLTVTLLHL